MGCDIHMYCEVRERAEGATWEPMIKAVFPDDYYRPEKPIGEYNTSHTHHPYKLRNYRLFENLCGVRSRGLYSAVSPSRGLPLDVTPEWEAQSRRWGDDGHSHSWLSLEECRSLSKDHDWWWKNTMPVLEALGKYSDVRVVFWFDN